MAIEDLDRRVRLAAFQFLEDETARHGETLQRSLLARGFTFDGQRVPLLGPQGIFKPAILPEIPLSITSVPFVEGRPRPYDDEMTHENLLRYRYRGEDPSHRDNAGLRRAMQKGAPLIYLHGVVPGRYVPCWPVYIVGDDPRGLVFTVSIDDRQIAGIDPFSTSDAGDEARRQYVTRLTRQRLHQQTFRQRVLRAYREQCAICRLRHEELLDAAHILPDGHPKGAPTVPNGIALCKLHHAAFDRHVLGIRPGLIVELRRDILKEPDGPMLRYGLQGFEGARLNVPRHHDLRPNPEFLAERYELFRKAG